MQEAKKCESTFRPVRYVENRNMCNDMALNLSGFLHYSPDTINKMGLACMKKKKDLYSEEKEWRLLLFCCGDSGNKDGVSLPFINPKTIIYGEDLPTDSLMFLELKKIR